MLCGGRRSHVGRLGDCELQGNTWLGKGSVARSLSRPSGILCRSKHGYVMVRLQETCVLKSQLHKLTVSAS